MKIIKILLFPFSIIYGIITAIRNLLFNVSVLKANSFDLPIINVGNLSMGGTGKTPHIEYLIRLLLPNFKLATLSRGYKRKSKGFVIAENDTSSSVIGDEPKQYKTKFPDITVAVCENRSIGISEILKSNNNVDCVLLDDAFQHRSLKAGFNVLLTDHKKLFTRDHVVPSGTLREFRCGAKRANVIIVTKCPKNLSEEEKNRIRNEINPTKDQRLFFSYIEYGSLVKLNDIPFKEDIDTVSSVLLFSGIADVKPLEKYLTGKKYSVHSLHFKDHHQYSTQDLLKIKESFYNIALPKMIIVTTEKDIMRIENAEQREIVKDLPIFYIPIVVDLFEMDKKMFNTIITDYVKNARKN